ncbi:MAG: class II aldolase/adducin family protein [Alphaproteobacteria bacterium]|nr:class II aldolase/adducin family protein [Alphaproteobacteria bacterium]
MVELDSLRRLSARAGSDPLLVQAAGGNTSLKSDGVMWIKASGTWLKDALTRDIFVAVDHAALMQALARNDPGCETCPDFVRTDLNASGLRPSIETTVHALMPQRVVVHVHCVNTIAWAVRSDAAERLSERLAGFTWAASPADRDALAKLCAGTPYRPAADDSTHALATDALALRRGRDKVFYPDHVVFLGVGVATSLASGAPLVALPGVGVVIRDDAKPAIEPMGRCLADVMRRVKEEDPLVALTASDIDRLVNWDAEKYRQTLKP